MKSYTITKKIAKHGRQARIIIPTVLQNNLSPYIVVQVEISILSNERRLK